MIDDDADERRARTEACSAWQRQADAGSMPLVGVVGSWTATSVLALTLVLVTLRMLGAVQSGAADLAVGSIGVAMALALLGGSWLLMRRGRRAVRSWIERAREADVEAHCPRCDAPLLARGAECSGARACGACGATLRESEGLLILAHRDSAWRQRRWSGAARARLSAVRRPTVLLLGPATLVPATLAAIYVLAAAAGASGASVGPPVSGETAFAPGEPTEGRAFADPEPEERLPSGAWTRAAAPMWLSTQVLALRGSHFAFGAIVNTSDDRAFVVFADGDTRWVSRDQLAAPELAEGDRIEIFDGARFVQGTLRERIGEALRVRLDGGDEVWTSVARLRARADAAHVRGEGLEGRVPPGSWVEIEVDQGVWRPGLVVDGLGEPLRVALSDGSAHQAERRRTRPQHVGPGVEVWVDGWREPVLVARRVGHALAVVDARGRRSWTALSRVRRRIVAP